jgi:hypothetical protein
LTEFVNNITDIITENDPISERSGEARRPVHGMISCCKDMLHAGRYGPRQGNQLAMASSKNQLSVARKKP